VGLGHDSPQQTHERGSGGRDAGHRGLTESGRLTTFLAAHELMELQATIEATCSLTALVAFTVIPP
jgi:hypothetical protein